MGKRFEKKNPDTTEFIKEEKGIRWGKAIGMVGGGHPKSCVNLQGSVE